MIQANIPKDPVVTMKVGIVPIPELKEVSQKGVELIIAGLYIPHALLNLFGPAPKIGSFIKTDLATITVAEKDGLTSRLETFKRLGKRSLTKLPDIKNKRETMITAKETAGKLLLPSSMWCLLEGKETL